MLRNIFGVSLAVLHACDVIVARAGKIIIKRNNPVAVFGQAFTKMRAYKTGAAGHQYNLLRHSYYPTA